MESVPTVALPPAFSAIEALERAMSVGAELDALPARMLATVTSPSANRNTSTRVTVSVPSVPELAVTVYVEPETEME